MLHCVVLNRCCFSRHIYLYFSQWFVTQGYPSLNTRTKLEDAKEEVSLMIEVTDYLATEKNRKYLLRTEAARNTARDIYSLGANFMFGMFFRHGSLPWLKNR
jgi:hypothetical protein